MDNIGEETQKMKPLETIAVILKSRGALGLQLLFRISDESVIEVKRVDDIPGKKGGMLPGDSIDIFFQIKALKIGTSQVTFYETQPWNKAFQEIIQKEINVEVAE